MAQPFKICPICETRNHRNATICTTCGTLLTDVDSLTAQSHPRGTDFGYDYRHGETDLYEGNLSRTARVYLFGIVTLVTVVVCGVLILLLGPMFLPQAAATPTSIVIPTIGTPRPTFIMATVTTGPPTATRTPTPLASNTPTDTPTPEPCLQRVNADDTLIGIVSRCGHRDLDILDVVVEINNLSDAGSIIVGQIIEVPWPTPTTDPDAVPTDVPEAAADTGGVGLVTTDDAFSGEFDPFAPPPSPTLRPGVMWHEVQFGETIISIAVQYGANIEIMSQLNPEVTFSQCDFGEPGGGGSCTVNLFEGQLLRVPAPTPTPTIPPTLSGSETPTPTPTATFNAPSAISPGNRQTFDRDQLITLRWVGTGTLAANQVYRVTVDNTTAGIVYTADTTDLFYIIPRQWQGRDEQRHIYTWTVSVIDSDNPANPYFTTEPRIFSWQGIGENQ